MINRKYRSRFDANLIIEKDGNFYVNKEQQIKIPAQNVNYTAGWEAITLFVTTDGVNVYDTEGSLETYIVSKKGEIYKNKLPDFVYKNGLAGIEGCYFNENSAIASVARKLKSFSVEDVEEIMRKFPYTAISTSMTNAAVEIYKQKKKK